MNAISAFVPPPVGEKIVVDGLFFHKDMLGQFGRIVIEETAQSIYNLCNSRGE